MVLLGATAVSGCPGSAWPSVQITLQGFSVGGSMCSLGPPGHVVSGLAPLLGELCPLGVPRHPWLPADLM